MKFTYIKVQPDNPMQRASMVRMLDPKKGLAMHIYTPKYVGSISIGMPDFNVAHDMRPEWALLEDSNHDRRLVPWSEFSRCVFAGNTLYGPDGGAYTILNFSEIGVQEVEAAEVDKPDQDVVDRAVRTNVQIRERTLEQWAQPPQQQSPRSATPKEDDELLTTKQVARWLQVSVEWLEGCRKHEGAGPKFVRVSSYIRYRRADVSDWLRANTHNATSEYRRS